MTATAFDFAICGLLLVLALACRRSSTDFRAAMLFIVFGLAMAVAWTRLQAPDLAIAEAALGAGVTGAMLLRYLRRTDEPTPPAKAQGRAVLTAAAMLLVVGTVLYAVVTTSAHPGLGPAVSASLPETGVSNPVTAVLLGFRGYDTLLEVCAVLIAAVAVWSTASVRRSDLPRPTQNPILRATLQWLVPAGVFMAGYVLWKGSFAPGGAFQSGAILAALAILLVVAGNGDALPVWGRVPLAIGSLTFLLFALGSLLAGRSLFSYRGSTAGAVLLIVEVAAAISVAGALTLFFLGGRLQARREEG